jgi:hypothetical protein
LLQYFFDGRPNNDKPANNRERLGNRGDRTAFGLRPSRSMLYGYFPCSGEEILIIVLPFGRISEYLIGGQELLKKTLPLRSNPFRVIAFG